MLRTLILRFALPAAVFVAATALLAMPYVERLYADWFRSDLDVRAGFVMASLGENLDQLADQPRSTELRRNLTRARGDQRLLAVQLCGPPAKDGNRTLYATDNLPQEIKCGAASDAAATGIVRTGSGRGMS